MNKKRRVVVTGLGLVTPLGLGLEENWQKALAGESGIRRITSPGTEKSPIQAVGEVKESDWKKIVKEFKKDAESEGEKRTLFALWAGRAALSDAVILNGGGERDRFGVVLAAGLGVNNPEDLQRWADSEGRFDYSRFATEYMEVKRDSIIRNNSNRASAAIAKRFKLFGPNSTITSACASASQAIGTGFRMIQSGTADIMVAGGSDSMINPVGLVFFVLLGAASTSAEDPRTVCRPFDRKRSGLVMGEGAGIVVLEEETHAVNRGASIYAEVAGYGSTMDAYQVTAPHPKGVGAERSMSVALSDSGLRPGDIDYINAHGTGTKLNDAAETVAIKNVFKDYADKVSISSSKSLIGHLLAASGGPEFVYTVLSVQRDEIHPTINQTNPDPKCDLDCVPNIKRSKTIRAALSNSFGFGGQNSTLVVKKYKS